MCTNQDLFKKIATKIESGKDEGVKLLIENALSRNIPAVDILNNGLVPGMNVIGVKFKNKEIFLPEVLIAARAMKAGLKILKPLMAKAKVKSRGKIIIGTVMGDLHDIGKNIVVSMLEGAGFDVYDLGIDVSTDKFVQAVENEKPDVLGMSALLTTTMLNMQEVIRRIGDNKLRNHLKIVIGGAPITQSFADEIGADGYAADAASAVDVVKNLLDTAS